MPKIIFERLKVSEKKQILAGTTEKDAESVTSIEAAAVYPKCFRPWKNSMTVYSKCGEGMTVYSKCGIE
jgi:hypothetical protein